MIPVIIRIIANRINNSIVLVSTLYGNSLAVDRQKETHFCAVWVFFRICWPNRAVLNSGFEAEFEDDASLFWLFLLDGWCALESFSDVAFGIVDDEEEGDKRE